MKETRQLHLKDARMRRDGERMQWKVCFAAWVLLVDPSKGTGVSVILKRFQQLPYNTYLSYPLFFRLLIGCFLTTAVGCFVKSLSDYAKRLVSAYIFEVFCSFSSEPCVW